MEVEQWESKQLQVYYEEAVKLERGKEKAFKEGLKKDGQES